MCYITLLNIIFKSPTYTEYGVPKLLFCQAALSGIFVTLETNIKQLERKNLTIIFCGSFTTQLED